MTYGDVLKLVLATCKKMSHQTKRILPEWPALTEKRRLQKGYIIACLHAAGFCCGLIIGTALLAVAMV